MADQDPTRETEMRRLYQALANEPTVAEGLHETAAAIAARMNRGSPWQPIDTCPQDGLFLVHEDGAIRCMYRSRGEWQATAVALDQWGCSTELIKVRETGVYTPTHWMPLPAPPE